MTFVLLGVTLGALGRQGEGCHDMCYRVLRHHRSLVADASFGGRRSQIAVRRTSSWHRLRRHRWRSPLRRPWPQYPWAQRAGRRPARTDTLIWTRGLLLEEAEDPHPPEEVENLLLPKEMEVVVIQVLSHFSFYLASGQTQQKRVVELWLRRVPLYRQ